MKTKANMSDDSTKKTDAVNKLLDSLDDDDQRAKNEQTAAYKKRIEEYEKRQAEIAKASPHAETARAKFATIVEEYKTRKRFADFVRDPKGTKLVGPVPPDNDYALCVAVNLQTAPGTNGEIGLWRNGAETDGVVNHVVVAASLDANDKVRQVIDVLPVDGTTKEMLELSIDRALGWLFKQPR